MGSIITNGESLVWDEWREREIPARATRSLLCQGMLIIVVCAVSSIFCWGMDKYLWVVV